MKSDMINDLMKIPDVKGDEMIYNSYNEKWNDDICLFGTKRSPHGDLFVKKMLGRRPRRSRGVQGWRGGIVYSKCQLSSEMGLYSWPIFSM
jgi:hypothetical protein